MQQHQQLPPPSASATATTSPSYDDDDDDDHNAFFAGFHSSTNINFAPADDIFFQGHLLPLHPHFTPFQQHSHDEDQFRYRAPHNAPDNLTFHSCRMELPATAAAFFEEEEEDDFVDDIRIFDSSALLITTSQDRVQLPPQSSSFLSLHSSSRSLSWDIYSERLGGGRACGDGGYIYSSSNTSSSGHGGTDNNNNNNNSSSSSSSSSGSSSRCSNGSSSQEDPCLHMIAQLAPPKLDNKAPHPPKRKAALWKSVLRVRSLARTQAAAVAAAAAHSGDDRTYVSEDNKRNTGSHEMMIHGKGGYKAQSKQLLTVQAAEESTRRRNGNRAAVMKGDSDGANVVSPTTSSTTCTSSRSSLLLEIRKKMQVGHFLLRMDDCRRGCSVDDVLEDYHKYKLKQQHRIMNNNYNYGRNAISSSDSAADSTADSRNHGGRARWVSRGGDNSNEAPLPCRRKTSVSVMAAVQQMSDVALHQSAVQSAIAHCKESNNVR